MKTERWRHSKVLVAALAATVGVFAWMVAGQAAYAQEAGSPPQAAFDGEEGAPPPPPPPAQGNYWRGRGMRQGPPPAGTGGRGMRQGPPAGGRGACPQGPTQGGRRGLRQGPPPGGFQGRGGARPGGRFQRPGPPDPDVIFDQMDANGDGSLSRDEFRKFHETRWAMRPMGPPMGPPPGGGGRRQAPAQPEGEAEY